jgi:long-subunit acyl-CoA synthetase (AMP-forming)
MHVIYSVGRADDVIVLANGEKVVPLPTEGALLSHNAVKGAILFGRERNQVGALVEPSDAFVFDPSDEVALAKYRNEIWWARCTIHR